MTGTITGKVVDTSNNPIKDVTVSVTGSRANSSLTNVSGMYTISGVEAGYRSITASVNSPGPKMGQGQSGGSSKIVLVTDGGTTTINFTLGKGEKGDR